MIKINKRRIAIAKQAFEKNRSLLVYKNLYIKTTKSFIKTYVLSILYCSDIKREIIKKFVMGILEAIEIRDFREEWGGRVGQKGKEVNRLAGNMKIKKHFYIYNKKKAKLTGHIHYDTRDLSPTFRKGKSREDGQEKDRQSHIR